MIPLRQAIARETFIELSDGLYQNHEEYRDFRKNHIQASCKMIWNTAQIALECAPEDRSTQALVLGAGPCADIPLAQLADAFDQTTLVDMDVRYALRARDNLPPPLREKVEVIPRDITGVFDEATAWIDEDFKYHASYLAHATDVLGAIDPKAARPAFDGHDFVVSHLVHDQFMGALAHIIRSGAEAQFNHARSSDDLGYDFYWNVLKAIGRQMEAAHFDLLADATHPTGVIHFAGSYDFRYSGSPKSHSEDPPFEQIKGHFDLLTEHHIWSWQISPVRMCNIAAYALRASE